jgi:hypothetical protein
MIVVTGAGADANAQSATSLLSAMARIREDSRDKVGWGLHWIAEGLAWRVLLVLS